MKLSQVKPGTWVIGPKGNNVLVSHRSGVRGNYRVVFYPLSGRQEWWHLDTQVEITNSVTCPLNP